MNRHVEKPVEVEAVQFNGHNAEEIIAWANHGLPPDSLPIVRKEMGRMAVQTPNGERFASIDDWIAKRGSYGDIYPCKPDAFEATCHPVNSQEYATKNP